MLSQPYSTSFRVNRGGECGLEARIGELLPASRLWSLPVGEGDASQQGGPRQHGRTAVQTQQRRKLQAFTVQRRMT